MGLEFLPSHNITSNGKVTGKAVKMLRDGNLETWNQYGNNNPLAQKWGLREIIKEYNGAEQKPQNLKKVSMVFADNPLLETLNLTGPPEKVKAVWRFIRTAADKASAIGLLKTMIRK